MRSWRAYGVAIWTCQCGVQHKVRSVVTESNYREPSKFVCPCGVEKALSGEILNDPPQAAVLVAFPQSPSGPVGQRPGSEAVALETVSPAPPSDPIIPLRLSTE
jgi:hypothetical protein